MECNEIQFNSMQLNEWMNGMEWHAMKWNGMQWNEIKTNRLLRSLVLRVVISEIKRVKNREVDLPKWNVFHSLDSYRVLIKQYPLNVSSNY